MNNNKIYDNHSQHFPDANGYFGKYGGSYLPKNLIPAFEEITDAYNKIKNDASFIAELRGIRTHFQGRPTPVYHCKRLSEKLYGAHIYLKREDLNYTGAHKLNHCMGEGLLAKFLGKSKIIAETGAGQHGVAIATAAAYFGLECDIYMGEVDIAKQASNVTKIKMLGGTVVPVSHGLKTLKEAVDAAFNAYMKEYKTSIYCIGSVVGPHPFPMMVRDFQEIIGIETKIQFKEMTGNMPTAVTACVGGGSNAIGMFSAFLNEEVELIGIEPMGRGQGFGDNAASITFGQEGIMHGFNSLMLKDDNGDPAPVYSIASGLDYPSVGPEHAYLHSQNRVKYESVTDNEAMEAFFMLCKYEGIIPAIESSHALAYGIRYARQNKAGSILVNLSGRGDKDIDYIYENYGYGEKFNI